MFSESACVIAPRLRSGEEDQTASDGECRRAARGSHHAAKLRDQRPIGNALRHRSNRQTAMERECRSVSHQGDVTGALSCDKAERTGWRRTTILRIAGRRSRQSVTADDNTALCRRRVGGHAKADARHQRLNRKRIGDPKGEHSARTSRPDKSSKSEHRASVWHVTVAPTTKFTGDLDLTELTGLFALPGRASAVCRSGSVHPKGPCKEILTIGQRIGFGPPSIT